MIRMVMLSAAMLVSAASFAQTTSVPAPAPAPVPSPSAASDLVRVTLITAEGPIVLALDRGRAPITVANFLRYVDGKRFDGTAFYRAMKLGDGLGLVQFGTSNDPKRTLKPIAHEPTSKTGISHTDGTLSMAMGAPGSAAGDVFIVVGDINTLDATATEPGFAAFGKVVEGMDIVRRILVAPTSPTKGEGVMRGQMLEPTIGVVSAKRG
jgi:peptidyl-prolyl cis-trans isomerase A (cyclophilin A)